MELRRADSILYVKKFTDIEIKSIFFLKKRGLGAYVLGFDCMFVDFCCWVLFGFFFPWNKVVKHVRKKTRVIVPILHRFSEIKQTKY